MPASPLSLAEWVVLTVIDEAPAHGFAVSGLTAPTGEVGRVWHIPRPVVYRALSRLAAAGLVAAEPAQPGQGPERHPYTVTPDGHERVAAWLGEPVAHVRQMRSEFLVRLALLDRRGSDPSELLARQRAVFAPIAAALSGRDDSMLSGFEATLAAWRHANVRAALEFLDFLDGRR